MSIKTPIGVRVPRSRRTRAIITTAAAAIAAAAFAGPASAAITPGETDGLTGFPLSYTDSQNISLGMCQDQSGNCIEAAPPFPDQPLAVPGNFTPDGEAFWWLADATMPNAGTGVVRFAIEAAFLNDNIVDGEQISFARTRYRFQDLVPNGWYRVTHPWGTTDIQADADGIINDTQDFGCVASPCAAFPVDGTPISSFLTWDTGAPAGYVGNPNIEHTVTGSPLGTNFVRLEQIDEPGALAKVLKVVGEDDTFLVQGKLAGPPPPPTANLGLDTNSLTFAARQVGTTGGTQVVTVTNHGTATMNIAGIALSGADAASFAQTTTCGATLAAKANCTISVSFAPKQTGDLSAAVVISDDAFGGPHSIAVRGNGTPGSAPAPQPQPQGQPQVIPGPPQTIIINRTGPGTAVPGTTQTGAAPRLGLQDLLPVGRLTRAKLRAQGLRLRLQLEDGTRVVRIAIFRAKRNGQRTGRPVFTTVRGVKATTTRITLRNRAVKRLKAGRYVARIQPGRNRADTSGVSSSVGFTVR